MERIVEEIIEERVVLESASSLRESYLAFYETKIQEKAFRKSTGSPPEMKCSEYLMDVSHVYTSSIPLDFLKRTSLDQLFVDIPKKGSYLLLRIIEPPLQRQIITIQTIVEDHLGNVITFLAKNFTDPDLNLNPEEVFPKGTVFALKEPFAEKSPNGNVFLTTDSPSDIIIIGRQHKMYNDIRNVNWINSIHKTDQLVEPTTGEGWKARGNELFAMKKYSLALEAYLVGLKYTNSPKTITLLHLNLTAVYIALGCFESCLDSAQKVFWNDQLNVKALYRAGRACYELRRFHEAKEHFDKLLIVDNTHLETAIEAERCVQRLKEQNGNVNIPDLFTRATNHPETLLDCADYIGPLDLIPFPGKGQGIVATSDIEPGTLLVVAKALVTTFKDNAYGGMVLVTKVMQEVLKNPKTIGKAVYNLTTNNSEMDGLKSFCDETTQDEPIVDALRIRNIVIVNSFGLHKIGGKGYGLFNFSSYFNHSCIPNSFWRTYNDVIVIYALQRIPRGQEVTIAYCEIEPDYSIRKANLMARGFQCNCELCQLDRNLPSSVIRRIGALLKESVTLSDDDPNQPAFKIALNILKNIIDEIENLYRNFGRDRMKTPLLFLYQKLAKASLKDGNNSRALIAVEDALESFGVDSLKLIETASRNSPYIFPDECGTYACGSVCHIVVTAMAAYNHGDWESDRWKKVLIVTERVCCGGNENMVYKKYLNE